MSATAAKYATLAGKAGFSEGTTSTLLYPADLFSGENQEQTSMTFFFNKIKNNSVSLGLKNTKRLVSAYGDIPIVHGEFSSGLLKKNGGTEVFSDLYHRSEDSITLPLPTNLNFEYGANWAQEDLGDFAAAINMGSDLSGDNYTDILKGMASRTGTSLINAVSAKRNAKLGALTQTAFGFVKNTYPEAVFKNMNFRTIQFNWKLIPRNANDSIAIKNILRMFRFHQAPEWLQRNGDGNNFLLYPSSVDVVFNLGSSPHPYIPRMMTSVINSVSMGVSTHGAMIDGAPTVWELNLTLTEMKAMTKNMIAVEQLGTTF